MSFSFTILLISMFRVSLHCRGRLSACIMIIIIYCMIFSSHFKIHLIIVPSPDVQVTHDGNTMLYAGSTLALTCTVTLPNVLSGYNVSVNTTWSGVRHGEHTTVTDATLVTNLVYSSMVVFSLLHTRDTGDYTCRANIRPPRGFGSISTEESHTLAIIIESKETLLLIVSSLCLSVCISLIRFLSSFLLNLQFPLLQ